MSDAVQLANRTVPLPGDPDHYVVILDVFHQLHCLVSHTLLVVPHLLTVTPAEYDTATAFLEHVFAGSR